MKRWRSRVDWTSPGQWCWAKIPQRGCCCLFIEQTDQQKSRLCSIQGNTRMRLIVTMPAKCSVSIHWEELSAQYEPSVSVAFLKAINGIQWTQWQIKGKQQCEANRERQLVPLDGWGVWLRLCAMTLGLAQCIWSDWDSRWMNTEAVQAAC